MTGHHPFEGLTAIAADCYLVSQLVEPALEQFAIRFVIIGEQEPSLAGGQVRRRVRRGRGVGLMDAGESFGFSVAGEAMRRNPLAGFAEQVVLHEAEPGFRRLVDFSEVGLEVVPARLAALVHQEFAVADDVIDRCAEFVTKLVEIGSGAGKCSVVELVALGASTLEGCGAS